jgi:uncharacterized protein DUF3800
MAFLLPHTGPIAFIDETGDHNLEKIDSNFPVFAICSHTTKVEDYVQISRSNLHQMKLDLFGTEDIVFHGHKIRQKKDPFGGLRDTETFSNFTRRLTSCFEKMDGHLIAAAIHKPKHIKKYKSPGNPFFLSLQFVLERLHMHWGKAINKEQRLHCVFESRGKKEDSTTEEWLLDICSGNNFGGATFPFSYEFQPKSENIAGHQYADLAAYTIARYVEGENENRKDWIAIKTKIRKSWLGIIRGYGLKIFP